MNSPDSLVELPLQAETPNRPTAAPDAFRGRTASTRSRPKWFRSGIEVLADFAALAAAWQAAAWVTQFSVAGADAPTPPSNGILLLYPAALALLHAHNRRAAQGAASLLSGMADLVIVLSVLSTAAGLFARQSGAPVPLLFLVLLPPLLVAFTTLGRTAIYRLQRRPAAVESVAVLGTYREASALVHSMKKRGDRSIRGVIVTAKGARSAGATSNGAANAGPAAVSVEVLGDAGELGALVNRFGLDRIIIQERGLTSDQLQSVLAIAGRMQVNTSRILDVERAGGQAQLIDFCGVPVIDLTPRSAHPAQGSMKRSFDFLGAAVLVVLTAPLFAAIALLIKLGGPGPVFYCGTRVGRGGRHVVLYKFRSMRRETVHRAEIAETDARDGHLYKVRRDPRITRVGGWLRRSSLDELPQLINVLRGEMSLVGPRPLPAEDLEPDGLSQRFRVWSLERAEVAPGITGLWQVRGRSDLPFDRMIDLDLRYAREWSPTLDIRILLETPLAVLAGRGAY